MPGREQLWHREVISPGTERALERLEKVSALQDFYLAGGTGLALCLGHRRSEDLDFFRSELFDEERLLARVQHAGGLALLSRAQATLHVTIEGTKVSFLGYPYPLLYPFLEFQNVSVADPRDIACMKISALAGRGTRRDFIDLYAASSQYGLEPLLELFQKKFAAAHYSKAHLLKSLLYFEDAEKDPMPNVLIEMSWKDVRKFLEKEVPLLLSVL